MKILVVEDDPRLGAIIAKYLQASKLEATFCQSAKDAWRILSSQPVDLVITDWSMPRESGTDLVNKIRQVDRFRTLPILMISGVAGKEDLLGAIQAGINGYLSKPFTIKQLKEKILDIWKQRHNSPLDAQIKRICRVHDSFDGRKDHPLILFGEPANTIEGLSRPSRRELVSYLIRATSALAQVKAANPGLEIGYLIEDSTPQVVKRVTSRMTRERVKLAIISSECGANSTMLIRLLNINKKEGLKSLLICDQLGSIPLQHQAALAKTGVEIAKRQGMSLDRLRTLIDESIIADQDSSAEGEVSPAEIRQRITKDLETMATLPVLPQVYQKIMSLADDPDSEIKDWSEAIKLDSMSCAVVLRRARSPAYGFQSDVSDIERAVILLGREEVKELIASESVKRAFSSIEEKGFSLDAFWLHSVAVGFAAKILSFPLDESQWTAEQKREFASFDLDDEAVSLLKETDLPKRLKLNYAREDPYVGGLVHDIGKGTMVQCYPELYPLLVEELQKNDWKVPMLAAESEVAGGLTHAAVGGVVAEKWELGEGLCEVAEHHHNSRVDNTFSFLIGAADIVGGILYPFPREAAFPLSGALEEGDLECVNNFLPIGFLEQSLLSGKEFISLARAISPAIKKRTNEMREMVG